MAGTIPDVPITVDAVTSRSHKTLYNAWKNGLAMFIVGGAIKRWTFRFPFEMYDDSDGFVLKNLEHPDNLLKEAKRRDQLLSCIASGLKTLPVDARGV